MKPELLKFIYETVYKHLSEVYEIEKDFINTKSRKEGNVYARGFVVYILEKVFNIKPATMSTFISRHRTTFYNSLNVVQDLLDTSHFLKIVYNQVEADVLKRIKEITLKNKEVESENSSD